MNPEQAFLNAVLEQPDDDAPRLMFADWLTERADPRGEFIRIQCELDHLEPDDDRRPALEDRETDLLAEHGDAWAKPVAAVAEEWRYRRGFVEDVTLDAPVFLERAASLFREVPIRRLGLRGVAAFWSPALAHPTLRGLRGLDLPWGTLNPAQLETMFDAVYSPRLRELGLPAGSIGANGLRVLAHHAIARQLVRLNLSGGHLRMYALLPMLAEFPRLNCLDLSDNLLTTDAIEQLAESAAVSGLRCLNLNGNHLEPGAARVLAASESLKDLTELTLGGNRFTPEDLPPLADAFPRLCVLDAGSLGSGTTAIRARKEATTPFADGWRALAQCPNLSGLHTLSLSRTGGGPAGAMALAESPYLRRLVRLNLSGCGIKDTAARALAESPNAARLAWLDLEGNEIGGPGVRALMTSPQLTRLRWLNLGQNFVGDPTAELIAGSPNVSRLTALTLSGNHIGSGGAVALARSPNLARLEHLYLSDNPVGDEGVRALASSPHLARLRTLTLGVRTGLAGPVLGSTAAKALLASPYLTQLKGLELGRCEITPLEKRALRERFGPNAVARTTNEGDG